MIQHFKLQSFRSQILLLLLLFSVSSAASPPWRQHPSSSFLQASAPSTELPRYPCHPPEFSSFPFCNASLPVSARSASLLSLLTLDDKIRQLSNSAAAVPRLGLPPYQWWSESLHGVADNGPGVSFFTGPVRAATGFPQVILSAAAFNRTLWRALAEAVAVEARAMHNVGQAGLTFWAPNINVFRDPRWGRGQETPGEDPLVAAQYAIQYVKGFQGEYEDDDDGADDGSGGRLTLSACCKHYTAYDLEKWGNFTRYTFNAKVTQQDMEDTFQPPFQSCIQEGHASCLMCSYNQVNGVPACARGDLIEKARKDWGFKGYVTSDCDAVAIIFEDQKYSASPEDSIADVLKAGMDINCGTYMLRYTKSAVDLGKVQEEDIDRALLNLFSVQIRLGLLDGEPSGQRNGRLGPNDVCTKEHRELALEAARQGIVLLKNDKNFLPFRTHAIGSLAIIGPAGNDTSVYGGDYTGVPCNPVSIIQGLQNYVPQVDFASGCVNVSCRTKDGFEEAINIAEKADFVVLIAGLNQAEETEDLDRISLLLPGKQMDLVTAIADVAKKPLVLILMGGGPLDVSFVKENPSVASILWIGYPGEIGGQAVAEALFGDFNPGGRLPITWYPEAFTKVPMNDMNMRADPSRGYPGRTYRFYTGDVVYKFGHGLSYSTYSYKFISVPQRISLSLPDGSNIRRNPPYARNYGMDSMKIEEVSSCEALRFNVQISVINNGAVVGSHTLLLFSRSEAAIGGAPQKQLIGFERVHVTAYGATEANLLVDPCKHLSLVKEDGQRVIPLGRHVIMLEDLDHELFIET